MPANRSREILESLGTSRAEPVSFLRTAARLRPAELKSLDKVDTKSLEKAIALGVQVVTGEDVGDSLLESPAPPPALFAWGQTECLKSPMVAIIGTRGATTYGKAAAQKFAEAFARAGLTVVSGGAVGIDLHAHEGALGVGGNTVAVLANGVEHAQPPQNRPLFDRIRKSGCLVSPYAIGTPAMAHRFRPRNELIAAMSLAVVVVEAPVNSGALMACGAAADMGREVFVVPGPINLPNYHGSHELIRDGATLVSTPDQVLHALDFQPAEQTKALIELTDVQRRILAALTVEPRPAEQIVSSSKLSTSEILTELTTMEIEGLIIRNDLGYAIRP